MVAGEGCRGARLFLGVETGEVVKGGVQEAHGARFFLIGFDWQRQQ